MKDKRSLVALGALTAALAACGSEISAPGDGDRNANTGATGSGATGAGATGGTTVTAGTTATGGSTAAAGGSGGSGAGAPTAGTGTGGIEEPPTCVPGTPASSQFARIRNRQYDAVVRDLLGVTSIAADENRKPSEILYGDYDGPMNVDSWRIYRDVAAKISAEVIAGPLKTNFIACDAAMPACITQTIKDFGRKAFRRPLTPEEEMSFARLASLTPAGTANEVAQALLNAFLVSPSFLMITELTTETEGSAIKLSQYETAARLSFLLWGSVPDADLSLAADNGQLATKEQILAQAIRMIGDRAKTAPLVAAYHRIYMDMENADAHWFKGGHDTTKFPLWSQASEGTMLAELDAFFEEVAFNNGSFKDLFTSPVGFVTAATAPIYGLPAANYGTELTKVMLDPAQRPGFLTRVGFLQSYSHFDATSPILRGAYITVNLIGVNPGAPDPDVFNTEPPPGEYRTERAYVEALTNQPSCKGCHMPFINPPGFVMESYDAIGAWQTTDPRSGDPVNTAATVTFGRDAAGNDITKDIATPAQLMEELAKGDTAKRIYASKWVEFATGRHANPNDTCTVDLIDANLARDDYTVLNLLADLTQADSFRLRVKGN